MTEHVVVAGGGPTGLMLAGELALAGVDVACAATRRRHSSRTSLPRIIETGGDPLKQRARQHSCPGAMGAHHAFHEAEHAAYVLRKSRCTSSAVRSTPAPFREREVSG